MTRTTTECQRRLIDLGYLPAVDAETLRPSDDGTFGRKSLTAYNNYRKVALHKPPVNAPDMITLNADLFPEDVPPPPVPSPNAFSQIGAVLSIINLLNSLKGTKMDSTKPWYASQTIIANIVALIAFGLTFFHVGFSAADQATLVNAVIEGIGVVSVIWGIIARITASKKIG